GGKRCGTYGRAHLRIRTPPEERRRVGISGKMRDRVSTYQHPSRCPRRRRERQDLLARRGPGPLPRIERHIGENRINAAAARAAAIRSAARSRLLRTIGAADLSGPRCQPAVAPCINRDLPPTVGSNCGRELRRDVAAGAALNDRETLDSRKIAMARVM